MHSPSSRISLFLLACFTIASKAWNINSGSDRAACQRITANPLEGCDEKSTLLVSPSTKGAFGTIQSAVLSLPNNKDAFTLLIEPGNYTEQINVTRVGPTYFLGQTDNPKDQSLNEVRVFWAAVTGNTALNLSFDNAFTAVLTVAPDLDADLTGAGTTGFDVPDGTPFGCVDFRTYNIDFINDFIDFGDGPSLALSMGYANAGFYQTGFYSWQDTIYVGKFGNAYFKGGVVAGETDFFYGFGTAWVTNTAVKLRNCGGGITAWKGTNTTVPNKFGIYIHNSTVTAANSTIAPDIVGQCALGRPWNAQMRSIFSFTFLDASILPTGFINWQDPPRYTDGIFNASVNNWGFNEYATIQAEFKNFGPGFNATARAQSMFDTQLTEELYEPFSSPAEVFSFEDTGVFGNIDWIDFDA